MTAKLLSALVLAVLATPAWAQAPPAAPLVLQLPATARAMALGDAWVTGRDSEVIFYNPAQIVGASRTFGVTFGRPGPARPRSPPHRPMPRASIRSRSAG